MTNGGALFGMPADAFAPQVDVWPGHGSGCRFRCMRCPAIMIVLPAGRTFRRFLSKGERLRAADGDCLSVCGLGNPVSGVQSVQESTIGGHACTFVIALAVVESPTARLRLNLDATGMQVLLQRLPAGLVTPPCPEWRAGREAWQNWRLAW